MKNFKKLNETEIEIMYVAERNFKPSFYWENGWHDLNNFLRVKNNPWIDGTGYPDYIHGIEDDYWNPLYIELINDYEVNVYERC